MGWRTNHAKALSLRHMSHETEKPSDDGDETRSLRSLSRVWSLTDTGRRVDGRTRDDADARGSTSLSTVDARRSRVGTPTTETLDPLHTLHTKAMALRVPYPYMVQRSKCALLTEVTIISSWPARDLDACRQPRPCPRFPRFPSSRKRKGAVVDGRVARGVALVERGGVRRGRDLADGVVDALVERLWPRPVVVLEDQAGAVLGHLPY